MNDKTAKQHLADGNSLTLIEVQANSSIPLQQNLIQIKGPNSFQVCED